MYAEELELHDPEEPLLHDNLVHWVRARRARGERVGFTADAVVLGRSMTNALVDAGVDWVGIRLDTTCAGIRMDRTLANLAGLLAARRRAGRGRPEVALMFSPLPATAWELPNVVELAARFGVDRVAVNMRSDTTVAAEYAFAVARRRADQLGVALRRV